MPKDPEKLFLEILKIDTGLLRSRFETVSHIAPLEGHRAVQDWLLRRYLCADRDLALVSGHGVTSDTGEAEFAIDLTHCLGSTAVILDEPELVATPNAESPVFLAATCNSTRVDVNPSCFLTRLDDSAMPSAPSTYLKELKIKVRTWAPGGTSAGRVRFSWVCVLEVARFYVMPG